MDEQIEQDIPLSKTKLKKLAKEVESLAKQLAELTDAAFKRLELDDELREEVILARETLGRGSHKRQIKHLAGLLRQHHGRCKQVVSNTRIAHQPVLSGWLGLRVVGGRVEGGREGDWLCAHTCALPLLHGSSLLLSIHPSLL